MQNVFLWSGVTYECTQVTNASALVVTTVWHTAPPASFSGMERVSGKVRSTRYRGIFFLLSSHRDEDHPRHTSKGYRPGAVATSGTFPMLGKEVPYLGEGSI